MKTEVLKVDLERIEPQKIRKIAETLKKDGIAVLPTETFYGLGAHCFSGAAVRRIFRLKGRDPSKPILLVISDFEMVERVAREIPPALEKIARKFWPGPLTAVLKASRNLPGEVTASTGTVGVRLPAHPWLRELIRKSGFPLTATSANISGSGDISDPEKVKEIFYGKVELIVDGGKTPGVKPSTILDLASKPPQILREGAIPASKIKF